MKFSTLIASAALLPSAAVAQDWTTHTVNERRYLKYIPTNHTSADGLMMFFHGVEGSADGMTGIAAGSYDIKHWADTFNFLALVPDGSSDDSGGGGEVGPEVGPEARGAISKESQEGTVAEEDRIDGI